MTAFVPLGNTAAITAATSAPTGVQITGALQYRVINNGTITAYLGIGKTAAQAQTAAAIPVSGTPASGLPLVPGAVEIISANDGAFFSAITASSTTTIFVTPGDGV